MGIVCDKDMKENIKFSLSVLEFKDYHNNFTVAYAYLYLCSLVIYMEKPGIGKVNYNQKFDAMLEKLPPELKSSSTSGDKLSVPRNSLAHDFHLLAKACKDVKVLVDKHDLLKIFDVSMRRYILELEGEVQKTSLFGENVVIERRGVNEV